MKAGDVYVYNEKLYKERFSEESQKYYRTHMRKMKQIIEHIKKDKPKILDIGCADGFLGEMLIRQKDAEVYGIDINSAAVNVAVKRGINARRMNVDGRRLNFPANMFDYVICGDVIEHIFDTGYLLEDIRRILKPGGYLIATVPNTASWYNRLFLLFGLMPVWIESASDVYTGNPFVKEGCGHIRAFTKKSFLQLLRLKKYRIEKVQGVALDGDGSYPKYAEMLWRGFEVVFSRVASLSSVVLVKARK